MNNQGNREHLSPLNNAIPLCGRRKKAQELIEQTCKEKNVNLNELRMGSRCGRTAAIRGQSANELVEKFGVPLAEVAGQPGVTTSAVSKARGRLSKT